jgi:hypothetical protein
MRNCESSSVGRGSIVTDASLSLISRLGGLPPHIGG